MRKVKQKRLEAKGWKVGGVKEFLGLSEQEMQYIDLKVTLAGCLREKRLQRRMGQIETAKLVRSSQSRVAKMEAADGSVSIDLIIRSLIALGATNSEIGKIIARSQAAA